MPSTSDDNHQHQQELFMAVQQKPNKLSLFLDDGTTINSKLCDSLANEQIQVFLNDKDKWGKPNKISSSQIRRFFGEMKGYYNRLRSGESYSRMYPMIKLIKSKACYACNRKKISSKFRDFIVVLVDSITENEKTFEAVMLHFEAVVGFMYGEERNLMN